MTSMMSLKKDGEVDSAMFENICDWLNGVQNSVLEVFKQNHVIHKEVSLKGRVGKTAQVHFAVTKMRWILKKFLKKRF